RRYRSVVDLTADRTLENGRIDEGGFGMRVARRIAARAVFDEHTLDALAGHVRQFVLVDERHLGILRLRRVRQHAAERQAGDYQRPELTLHGFRPLPRKAEFRLLPATLGAIRRASLCDGRRLRLWLRPSRATPAGADGSPVRAWPSRSRHRAGGSRNRRC